MSTEELELLINAGPWAVLVLIAFAGLKTGIFKVQFRNNDTNGLTGVNRQLTAIETKLVTTDSRFREIEKRIHDTELLVAVLTDRGNRS